jgi:hypothetical protein
MILVLIIWFLFKLALVIIPVGFGGGYYAADLYTDKIFQQTPNQIVYWIPITDKNKPQVTVTVTYPTHVKTGDQYSVIYEIKNYSGQVDLKFDLQLKSGNKIISTPVIFSPGNPTRVEKKYSIDADSKLPIIQFQPYASYERDIFKYTIAHQIQGHMAWVVYAIYFLKWLLFLLCGITLVAWVIFLVSL